MTDEARIACPVCVGEDAPRNRFTLQDGGTVCVLCCYGKSGKFTFGERSVTEDVAAAFRFGGYDGVLQIPVDDNTRARVKKWIKDSGVANDPMRKANWDAP